MNCRNFLMVGGFVLCCSVLCVIATEVNTLESLEHRLALTGTSDENAHLSDGLQVSRPKRTLFLKKKLLGAGLLGFGLGVAKGYKAGYYHQEPEVHHVYVAPPPPAVKYVEYVEKPVYVERIIEKPVFKQSASANGGEYYEPSSWSQQPHEPSRTYGSW